MRLTNGMLESMIYALNEVEAAGRFQGADDKENEVLLRNLDRAQAWISIEFAKRREAKEGRKRAKTKISRR